MKSISKCFLIICVVVLDIHALQLTSNSLQKNGVISAQCTCDSGNSSPQLAWSGVPKGTKSLVMVMDDPDATYGELGAFVHWILFNIPVTVTELPRGVVKSELAKTGIKQGTNTFRAIAYGGPCPPQASTHHYRFSLYALNTYLPLKEGATLVDINTAMHEVNNDHVIEKVELIGLYSR